LKDENVVNLIENYVTEKEALVTNFEFYANEYLTTEEYQ